MIELAFGRLRTGRRLCLVVLLYLSFAAALPAALAGHAQAVSARELGRSLAGATPAERTLLITGSATTFRDELYAGLQGQLGPFLQDRLVIRHSRLAADAPPASQQADERHDVGRLDVYSFDQLAASVRIVDGRLPDPIQLYRAIGNWPPSMEAVVGARAAEASGVRAGDRLTANNLYYRFDIVGIVEPIEPGSDLWGGDLGSFQTSTDPTTDTISLPLIIAPQSMQAYLGRPIFQHETSWRVTLDTGRIDPDAAQALRSGLVNFQNQATTRGATVRTGLVRLLSGTLDRLSRVRAPFLLLTVQTLLYVLYALGIIALLVADRARPERTLLSARGMNTWQIAGVWAAQHLMAALVAGMLLGPGLAWGITYLWSGSVETLPVEAWLLSIAVAAAGWLLLMLPAIFSARQHAPDPPPHARTGQVSPVQKHYLDLYLLAFAGLLYWQLRQRGSFLMRQLGNTQAADPLLLIGPTLLLVAGAIVFLRAVPLLLLAAAWMVQRLRGLSLSLALLHSARDPRYAGHLVLLVSLAAGMMLFGLVSGHFFVSNRDVLQATAPIQGVISALQLNALMVLLLSLATAIVASVLVAPRRRREFQILCASGLPGRQWLRVVVLEDLVLLGVGLLAGSLAGWVLARSMIPTLYPSLAGLASGDPLDWVAADWPTVARSCAALFVVYGTALALGRLTQLCSLARWCQSIGDE